MRSWQNGAAAREIIIPTRTVNVPESAPSRQKQRRRVLERRLFCNCAVGSFRPATLDADSLESLPKTSTDKIDYQKLKGMK